MSKTNSIDETNRLLKLVPPTNKPLLVLLTGSSGCGKTYLAQNLEKTLDGDHAGIFYFDSIGVPSPEDMVRIYGSGEKWQEAMTNEWVKRLVSIRDKTLVILEGQFHPKFAIESCSEYGVSRYVLALITCDEVVWTQRLLGPRNQPDLITQDMRNWAKFLRFETEKTGGAVIDTTDSDLDRNLDDIAGLINPLLQSRMQG